MELSDHDFEQLHWWYSSQALTVAIIRDGDDGLIDIVVALYSSLLNYHTT